MKISKQRKFERYKGKLVLRFLSLSVYKAEYHGNHSDFHILTIYSIDFCDKMHSLTLAAGALGCT